MWWHDDPNRFLAEYQMLKRNYPRAKFTHGLKTSRFCTACSCFSLETQEHIAIFAEVITPLGCSYPVVVVYPCDFPHQIPSAWPLSALKPSPPSHQFRDGRLCLTDNENDRTVTGCMVLSWAYGWLTCYDIWKKTGKFLPGNYGKHRI